MKLLVVAAVLAAACADKLPVVPSYSSLAPPAPQSYSAPAAPQYQQPSYSAPAPPAPQSYSAPAAPAQQSYSAPAAPAQQSYSAPAAPQYQQPSYSAPAAPAPQSYSAPAAPQYQQPSYSAPAATQYGQVPQILSQEFDLQDDQSYVSSFETSNGIYASESGNPVGGYGDESTYAVQGKYSYVGDDGVTYTVTYVADANNGFQPQAAHLPTPPPTEYPTPEVPATQPSYQTAPAPSYQAAPAQPQYQSYQPQYQ